jgi:hypothetical protein
MKQNEGRRDRLIYRSTLYCGVVFVAENLAPVRTWAEAQVGGAKALDSRR